MPGLISSIVVRAGSPGYARRSYCVAGSLRREAFVGRGGVIL